MAARLRSVRRAGAGWLDMAESLHRAVYFSKIETTLCGVLPPQPFIRPCMNARRPGLSGLFPRLRRLVLLPGVLIVSACLLSAAKTNLPLAAYEGSPQFANGVFRNPVPKPADGLLKPLDIVWNVLLNKPADAAPNAAPPVLARTRAEREAAPDRSLFRRGHSTMLIKRRG